MTRKIRFIHAADIHLGAPVRGLCDVSPEWASALQEATANAWERVVGAAIAHEVDFIIIAGDLFDSARPSYGDYVRLFDGLEKLHEAHIPSFLVTGNHDPFTSWERDVSRLPKSATLLGVNKPQFALFSRDDEPLCLLGGRSYYNQAWPSDESMASGITRTAAMEALMPEHPNASDAPFAIGVIHAGLEPDQSKACVELDELLDADVDYWACGHLHERHVFLNEVSPCVVYPGCVQGQTIDEGGECGCFLVEMEEGMPSGAGSARVNLEFIPTSSIVLQKVMVDVSACQTLADVRRHVQSELFHEMGKNHCDDMIVQITLVGDTELHEFLAKSLIMRDLRHQINNAHPNFYCDLLRNKTRLPQDDQRDRENDELFIEIVETIAEEQRSREDVIVNFIQSEFVKRGVTVPSMLSDCMGERIDEAERLVLDLLRGDSE